jgi:hypothetical protein
MESTNKAITELLGSVLESSGVGCPRGPSLRKLGNRELKLT